MHKFICFSSSQCEVMEKQAAFTQIAGPIVFKITRGRAICMIYGRMLRCIPQHWVTLEK